MNILALNGSPREEGNCDTFLNEILNNINNNSVEFSKIHIYDLEVSGCTHCSACKEGTTCVLKDEMQPLYEKIKKSDILLIAFPIYMGDMPGPLKSVLDRFYAFIDKDFQSRLSPKKLGLFSFWGAPNFNYMDVLDRYSNVLKMFEFKTILKIGHGNMTSKDTVKNSPKLLEEAKEIAGKICAVI